MLIYSNLPNCLCLLCVRRRNERSGDGYQFATHIGAVNAPTVSTDSSSITASRAHASFFAFDGRVGTTTVGNTSCSM